MKKKVINTTKAPSAIGPYNQSIKVNDTLFVSGQIPLVPKTMELISGNIQKETRQVMKNLESILKKAGMSFKNVVKSTIYLDDMKNFSKVNDVYGSYFEKGNEPARETVAVKSLPKGVRIEISMIAIN
ncbi:MAG: reactive intermediate/imine deaminase [Flavobacteriaceae bacterium]|nr:reactive intermediate/imine deaminase [Flavobacteriaceae bacterium]|tara:strand:- start:12910 stop:13293 length:384 start_codon:yes stop_codon:yes gene_type:complete